MKSVSEITSEVVAGKTKAVAIVESSLKAAAALQQELNAFLQLDNEGALARARSIDTMQTDGNSLPALAGVPIAIKDNICVRGMQTSCGSKILGDHQPPYDATAIERLQAAGAVIIGKLTAMSLRWVLQKNSAFGPVKNPWDVTRVPGGSSGGSAAAVAAGIVPVALGPTPVVRDDNPHRCAELWE